MGSVPDRGGVTSHGGGRKKAPGDSSASWTLQARLAEHAKRRCASQLPQGALVDRPASRASERLGRVEPDGLAFHEWVVDTTFPLRAGPGERGSAGDGASNSCADQGVRRRNFVTDERRNPRAIPIPRNARNERAKIAAKRSTSGTGKPLEPVRFARLPRNEPVDHAIRKNRDPAVKMVLECWRLCCCCRRRCRCRRR